MTSSGTCLRRDVMTRDDVAASHGDVAALCMTLSPSLRCRQPDFYQHTHTHLHTYFIAWNVYIVLHILDAHCVYCLDVYCIL